MSFGYVANLNVIDLFQISRKQITTFTIVLITSALASLFWIKILDLNDEKTMLIPMRNASSRAK